MQVNYCDLCGVPLKENNYYMLYVSGASGPNEPETRNFDEQMGEVNYNSNAYHERMAKIEREMKEICPACKAIFDKMFELRMERIGELADEILLTFQKKAKPNPKERKQKDKK